MARRLTIQLEDLLHWGRRACRAVEAVLARPDHKLVFEEPVVSTGELSEPDMTGLIELILQPDVLIPSTMRQPHLVVGKRRFTMLKVPDRRVGTSHDTQANRMAAHLLRMLRKDVKAASSHEHSRRQGRSGRQDPQLRALRRRVETLLQELSGLGVSAGLAELGANQVLVHDPRYREVLRVLLAYRRVRIGR